MWKVPCLLISIRTYRYVHACVMLSCLPLVRTGTANYLQGWLSVQPHVPKANPNIRYASSVRNSSGSWDPRNICISKTRIFTPMNLPSITIIVLIFFDILPTKQIPKFKSILKKSNKSQ